MTNFKMEIKDLVLKNPTFSAPASIITAVSDNLDLIKEYADILKAALLALEKRSVTQEEYDKFVANIGASMIKYGNSDFPSVEKALDALFGSVDTLNEKTVAIENTLTKKVNIADASTANLLSVTQEEAEAGTSEELRAWSPLSVARAIAALAFGGSSIGVIEEYKLTLISDLTNRNEASRYWKNPFGEVTVIGYFNKPSGLFTTKQSIVFATLPIGFRPKRTVSFPAILFSGVTDGYVSYTTDIEINSATGTMMLRIGSTHVGVNMVGFNVSFLAN